MRKIWWFSAPGKRNLVLVVPRADVAVPGLCLSDYWAFWIPGTSAAAAAAPLREGRDRKWRRKGGSEEEEGTGWVWVCVCVSVRACVCASAHTLLILTVLGLGSTCVVPAKRCHLVSSPTDSNVPWPPHVQGSPRGPHSWGRHQRLFCGYVSASID